MAGIRRKQAIHDFRNAFTRFLESARDLRELKAEYDEAWLLNEWQTHPEDFDEHGFLFSTLVAAIDDFAALNPEIESRDANMRKVRN
jgi:hypothetical protein